MSDSSSVAPGTFRILQAARVSPPPPHILEAGGLQEPSGCSFLTLSYGVDSCFKPPGLAWCDFFWLWRYGQVNSNKSMSRQVGIWRISESIDQYVHRYLWVSAHYVLWYLLRIHCVLYTSETYKKGHYFLLLSSPYWNSSPYIAIILSKLVRATFRQLLLIFWTLKCFYRGSSPNIPV